MTRLLDSSSLSISDWATILHIPLRSVKIKTKESADFHDCLFPTQGAQRLPYLACPRRYSQRGGRKGPIQIIPPSYTTSSERPSCFPPDSLAEVSAEGSALQKRIVYGNRLSTFLVPYGNEDDILRVTLAHAGPGPNGGCGDIKASHEAI